MGFKDVMHRVDLELPEKSLAIQSTPIACVPANQVTTKIIHADCAIALKSLPGDSIDFVITSPPYANQRKHTYGGVSADKYVTWFLPIADELYRVLKPTGSFVLNIKEHVVNGERHPYVMELIIAMRKRGWIWTEEYVWHKRNACPGKWPNRFRDAWERCEHFTKNKTFAMYQEAVMVPMGDWRYSRLNSLRKTDRVRQKFRTNSGFEIKKANWADRKMAYPDNVLYLATECGNKGHSAVFPERLPEWFIKLFTEVGDTVLDPFMGSGTTLKVSQSLERHSIGIDIQADYCATATSRLGLTKVPSSSFPLTPVPANDAVIDAVPLASKDKGVKRNRPIKPRNSILSKNAANFSREDKDSRRQSS